MHTMGFGQFWETFQSGVEIAVGGTDPDKLLGVRDGFQRYFHDGLRRPVAITVHPEEEPDAGTVLPFSDEETLELARDRALELRARTEGEYAFYACSETGLHSLRLEQGLLHFVRTWTHVVGRAGEASGASGSVQLPHAVVDGLEETGDVWMSVPGKRRRGGMTASLTGGLESRRHAVAHSTLLAISTLFYGVVENRPPSRRPGL